MEDPDTDTLRKLAPCWTLAGDERLLTILQNTHQRLVAKCQEANCQLEQMATALDDASITLQNVNNQFMALSSRQFIESRVYDDDADVATDTPAPKESPKPSPPDELSILKRSIAVIESTHEVITILHDSDTESESDDDLPDRLVMKPKDLYADRPLPYIIGSEPWKNKWHAGLLPEDTDTDSSTSKVDRESDQYSLSEPEDSDPVQHTKVQGSIPVPQHIRKVSDTSSELPSEATPTAASKPTPSDVASELARRLGGGLPPKTEPEPEYEEPARPAVRKIYRPQEPITSTIFPDEPPPLDTQSEEEGDIFASLHRQQQSQQYEPPRHVDAQHVSELLFGDDQGDDIFSDFANQPSVPKPTSLFDAGPKPHMFDRQPVTEPLGVPRPDHLPPRTSDHPARMDQAARTDEQSVRTEADDAQDIRGVKKPVGGISLFGTNKGAESIGAAILKRNRRKSSTSGDESGYDAPEPPPVINEQAKKEKDIFDDLFAKSEAKKVQPKPNNIVKDIKQEIQKKKEEKIKKDTPKAVDLFSDNLFDDIDDIFTTNVVKTSKDNKKSIFEDDDDLFSEIAEPKPVKQDNKKSNDVKKSLFDSDDDLFSDNIAKDKPSVNNKTESIAKVSEIVAKPAETTKVTKETTKVTKETTKVTKESTSIFDDDEDNIFSNIKTSKSNDITKVQNVTKNTGDSNLAKPIETTKKVFNSPSLFDDDDDDSDLFAKAVKSTKVVQKNEIINKPVVETPNEIEDDNIDIKETKKTTDITITRTEIAPKVIPNITEVNSRETVEKTVEQSLSSVKADDDRDDIINKKTNLAEEQSIITTKVDNEINNTESYESTDNKSEPIKEVLDTNDSKTNIKTTVIQQIDDNNDKTSDDDFSEQDFDDEPVPEFKPSQNNISNTIPEIKPDEIHNDANNIFDNTALEEDIFALTPNNIPNFDKPNITKTENIETKNDNKTDATPSDDIFTDIVTEPPAFEKPKEPKKSKNVNALFDDDSDDEALFFKKEDVISDEKPDDFTVKQDRLFGIFTDEPPDVDFSKIDDDLDDDLFSTLPKPKIPSEKIPNNVPVTEDLPIPEDTPTTHDIPVPNKSIFDDIPTTNDSVKNETPISTAEKQSLQEDSKVLTIESKEDTDSIFKVPTSEIKSTLPKETSIFYDKDDLIKEPASLTSNIKETQDNLLNDDEELFKSLPVQLPQQKTNILRNEETDYRSDEELFKSLPIMEKPSVKEVAKPSISNKDIFKTPLQRSNSTNTDLKQEKSDVKKVGKLKVGLNINVNALLPGASPKKVKTLDSPDGQTQSVVETEKDDPKLTKSVSFDGKPGSEVLDNKLSKERPRIQVKRRPSTRKARREAVRKSGIDFGDDSTDNSSSIDDPPKPQPKVKQVENIIKVDDQETINKNEEYTEPVKVESHTTTKSELDVDKIDTQAKIEPVRQPVKSDSTTKIVYILNDEDIFNTSAIETLENKHDLPISKENIGNNATTAKNSKILASNLESNPGIKTLGQTYKSTKSDENKTAKSLFGEENSDDDDELFKNKKAVAKTSIFDDSDSDGELFGSSKKVGKVMKVDSLKEKVMKVDSVKMKGSLFGDDDDDDDLFGVKTKKSADSLPQPSRSTPSVKETSKSAQPVFEDPLSMFGDDD